MKKPHNRIKKLLKKFDGFKFVRKQGRTYASYKSKPFVEITDIFSGKNVDLKYPDVHIKIVAQ